MPVFPASSPFARFPGLVHDNYPFRPERQLTASTHKQTTGLLYPVQLKIASVFDMFFEIFLIFFVENPYFTGTLAFDYIRLAGRLIFGYMGLDTFLQAPHRPPLILISAQISVEIPPSSDV